VIPREINSSMSGIIPFSVLGPTRGHRQADLWEAMMNVNGGHRIRSLRYLSGMYIIILFKSSTLIATIYCRVACITETYLKLRNNLKKITSQL